MSNKHLVVIPTFNELANLAALVDAVLTHNKNVDVLIVDDNSPDGTGALADQLAKESRRVSVLHRAAKSGLGPAYLAGFQLAFERGYEFIIEMDADGSHRPEDLVRLIATDADLVIGSRWVRGGSTVNWPLSRQLISRLGNLYVHVMLALGVRDATAGFRVYRSELLKKLDLATVASHGYSFQVEMTLRAHQAKATIREVPITFVERVHGVSKMTSAIVLEAMLLVTKLGLLRLLGGKRT